MANGQPSRLRILLESDASGVGRGTQQAQGSLGKLSGSLGKLGGVAGVAFAAVGAAAIAGAAQAVKAASDLEQSQGAVETIFGKSAAAVEKYASTSAQRLGLAKSEYNTLATAAGTSFKNMGKSTDEAAQLTDQLVTRAADLAATFGGTTKDATEALGSAFRGEFDSVERLGITLKASTIQAELAKRGQDKLTGAALQNAQGQATLDLIMKQTAGTAGAFGRESNTLAGQQERLKATVENAKAAIGARLLPVLVAVAQFVTGRVVPAVKQFAAQVGPRLQPVLAAVGAFITGRVVPAFRMLADFILTKVIPTYKSYLIPIFNGVKSALAKVTGAVSQNTGNFSKLGPVIEKVGSVLKIVGKVIQTVAPIIGTVLGGAFSIIGTVVGTAIGFLNDLIGVADRVVGAFQSMADKVGNVVGGISSAVDRVGGLVGKIPGLALEVDVVRPDLTGGPGGLGPSLGMLQASSAMDPLAYSLGGGAGRSRAVTAGGVINMPITINGALDPVAVARQLERVLRDHAIRLGRRPAFGV